MRHRILLILCGMGLVLGACAPSSPVTQRSPDEAFVGSWQPGNVVIVRSGNRAFVWSEQWPREPKAEWKVTLDDKGRLTMPGSAENYAEYDAASDTIKFADHGKITTLKRVPSPS